MFYCTWIIHIFASCCAVLFKLDVRIEINSCQYEDLMEMEKENEIILYHPDSSISLEVRVEDETFWLTQQQMAELFQTTRNNITLHIRNIFKEGELEEFSVCKESLLTASDGKKYKTRFYNLDVIISVGYRIKSKRGGYNDKRLRLNNILRESKIIPLAQFVLMGTTHLTLESLLKYRI